MAAQLNKQHGLTVRRTCAVLRELFELQISPGRIDAGAGAGGGKRAGAVLIKICWPECVPGPIVHSDETSWWVGGPGYWLWVFANKGTTVYQVAKGRGRSVVAAACRRTVLPAF